MFLPWFSVGACHRGNWPFESDINKMPIKWESFEFVTGQFLVNNISTYLFDFFDEDSCWLLSSFRFPRADFLGTEPVDSLPLPTSNPLLFRLLPRLPRLLFKLILRSGLMCPFPGIMCLFSDTWANAISKSLSVRLLSTLISGSISSVSYASIYKLINPAIRIGYIFCHNL